MVGAWITSTLVFGFIAAAMVFFMWWPDARWDREVYQNYVLQVGIGMTLVLVIGVVLALIAPRWRARVGIAGTEVAFDHPEAGADVALEGIAPDDAADLHRTVDVDSRVDADR